MRAVRRPRKYLPHYLLMLLSPVFRYSASRDAYVLRAIGNNHGPVLRVDRRTASRRSEPDPADRRSASAA
jgi:hypothetical protein